MKKILALLIAVMMLLVSVSAFAAGVNETESTGDNTVTTTPVTPTAKNAGEFSITMTSAEDNHTFKAYRIFDGNIDKDGKLGDISWATGVDTTGIAAKLAAAGVPTTIGTAPNTKTLDLSKAADVAQALGETTTDDTALMIKVADVFFDVKGDAAATASTKATGTNNYVLTPLVAGYYLVTDEYTDAEAVKAGDETLSRNVLAVVGNVTAEVKNTKPEIDKQVLKDNGEWEDSNEAGIGETVFYKITTKVPNYTGYDKYWFVINDKLSDGLTFNGANTIKVVVGQGDSAKTLVPDTDYVVYTGNDADGNTFQIAFKNIMKETIAAAITVTYSATVNADAVIGSTGNPNETELIYSNNPNDTGDGTPSDNPKPDEDNPTGKTPKAKTITYVAELDLTKYFDAIKAGNELKDAQFTLTGTSTWMEGTTADSFVADANGNYYKLTDGTYTTTVPHGDITRSDGTVAVKSNESAYDSTTQKYSLTKDTTWAEKTNNVFMQGTSGDDGKIVFKGLGAGTYTLTETVTPAGYNTADPITFTISVTLPDAIVSGEEKATWASNNAKVTVKEDTEGKLTTGVYEVSVVDLSGSTLPSTGGIGTTIFYIGGSILVLAAVILLITKRRMGAND